MSQKIEEVIIIGSGPAGLTAGIYTGRADLSPLLFGGYEYGGQLMGTTDVENYPGFPEGIQGPELMTNMIKQAQKYGARIEFKDVTKVDFSNEIKKVYVGEEKFLTKSVIIALGASPRKLNIPGEQEYWGKGVSACATCDAAFYREKDVAIAGGGDSAMEEANFLTRFANKVYLIHRRSEFRASKAMQKKVFDNEKIEVVWNTDIKKVLGKEKVTGLKLFNNKENSESTIDVDGFFLAIGHIPNTKLVEEQLELDEYGYIKVSEKTQTSAEGVFVAGDVKDHEYQQAITAAGMGCMAALDAERYLIK